MDSGASRTGTPVSLRSHPRSPQPRHHHHHHQRTRTPVKSASPILSRCLRRNSSTSSSTSSLIEVPAAAVMTEDICNSSINQSPAGKFGSRVRSGMKHHHQHQSTDSDPRLSRPGSGEGGAAAAVRDVNSAVTAEDVHVKSHHQSKSPKTPPSSSSPAPQRLNASNNDNEDSGKIKHKPSTLRKMWASLKNSPIKKTFTGFVSQISTGSNKSDKDKKWHENPEYKEINGNDLLRRNRHLRDPMEKLKKSHRMSVSHPNLLCHELDQMHLPSLKSRDDMALLRHSEESDDDEDEQRYHADNQQIKLHQAAQDDHRIPQSSARALSLDKEYPFYQLEVHLNAGINLLAMDAGGTSDPYVKFKLGSRQVYRSRTIYKTLNPVWNEHFMTIIDDINQTLVLRAYDHDFALSDDFLGMASIDLSKLIWNEAIELTLDLTENGGEHEDVWGQLVVGIRLQPKTQEEKECLMLMLNDQPNQLFGKGIKANMVISSSADGSSALPDSKLKKQKTQIWDSVVNVILIEGKNLSAKDENGFSDPYVRFKLGNQKHKSKVCPKTLNPQWNEQFSLHAYPDQPKLLEVSVFDRDATRDDLMGFTSIDINSLAPETDHHIVRELEGGEGCIHLVVTVSGTLTTPGHISDLASFDRNHADRAKEIKRKYGLLRTLSNMKDVGFLTVKVFKAENLAAADFSGKSDPFCVLQLVNSRLQTNTQYKTLNPEWNKIFTFRVNDIHEALDVTVFDEDPNQKFEFLGRVKIPLLSIQTGVKKWYTLKDKRCVTRSKGQILLELSLTYNPIRASIRTVNPKETMIVTPDPKFKRSVFIRNVNRTKAIVMEFVELIKFIKSCFLWESVPRSLTAFLLFLLITYFFEAYMAPLALLLLFAQSYIRSLILARFSPHKSADDEKEEEDAAEVDPADDVEDEGAEKKSLREKLQAVQEITALVQNVLGEIASMADRIRNTFDFSVPFLSYLALFALLAAAILLFFVPLRYIILIWGINKFTKKLRSPNAIDNNELMDFLSRVPDTDEKIMYRELKPEGKKKTA